MAGSINAPAIRYQLGDMLLEREYGMEIDFFAQEDVHRSAGDPAFRIAE